MTDLSELRERLEKAEEPSRELDALIHTALFPKATVNKSDPTRWMVSPVHHLPDYTFSLDAAVALVERVKPSANIGLTLYRGGMARGNFASVYTYDGSVHGQTPSEWTPNPALALCIALVRAMEADDDRG